MRYLLDTHILYRWLRNDKRLGRELRKILASADCFVSGASIWEMLIKNARGKLPLPPGSLGETVEANGFQLIPIAISHIGATTRFDLVINDPFDRLMVATAATERMTLITQGEHLLANAKRLGVPISAFTG